MNQFQMFCRFQQPINALFVSLECSPKTAMNVLQFTLCDVCAKRAKKVEHFESLSVELAVVSSCRSSSQ